MVLLLILQSLWFIFPAYASNALPILIGGRHPIDFRIKLGKYRLLGDGKTIEGTLGGIVFGILVGWLQMNVHSALPDLGLIKFTLPLIVLLSVGAILGDIVGAFIKRRLGIPRGYPAPLLDQLDFLVGGLLAASAVTAISKSVAVTLLIITPIIHIATNRVSYWLKMKKVPW